MGVLVVVVVGLVVFSRLGYLAVERAFWERRKDSRRVYE